MNCCAGGFNGWDSVVRHGVGTGLCLLALHLASGLDGRGQGAIVIGLGLPYHHLLAHHNNYSSVGFGSDGSDGPGTNAKEVAERCL